MASYDGPIVDVDIHHRWHAESDIVEYLPQRWRDYMHANPRALYRIIPTPLTANALIGNRGRRLDAYVDGDPAPPGWSYEMLRDQLLDPNDYYRGLLTHDLGEFSCLTNPSYGTALASAVNDWSIDRWLDLDDRLYSLAVIPTHDAQAAAREIRRVGAHPKIVGVLLAGNPHGRPFGDPIYHPIYEAAEELGLAISIHVATADRPDGEVTKAGGPLATAAEYYATFAQAAMHYVASFITHGVFEKFPSLHVMVKEYGVCWLPFLIWRLDDIYAQLRLESDWVKRPPSEYIREHLRFSTQPIEDSTTRGGTAQMLSTIPWLEEILCFSTDYPHYSFDKPSYVARILPDGWARRVFCDNACAIYGWEIPRLASAAA
jgi:predicted TIM-barrel fold metal-dependent hydrolase